MAIIFEILWCNSVYRLVLDQESLFKMFRTESLPLWRLILKNLYTMAKTTLSYLFYRLTFFLLTASRISTTLSLLLGAIETVIHKITHLLCTLVTHKNVLWSFLLAALFDLFYALMTAKSWRKCHSYRYICISTTACLGIRVLLAEILTYLTYKTGLIFS